MTTTGRSRFADLGTVIAGQHIPADQYDGDDSGTLYLTGPADFTDRLPRVTKWTHRPRSFSSVTDVLLTVKGAGCGKSNLGIDAAIGRQLMALRPDPAKLDRNYLFNFIRSQEERICRLGQGATVPGIAKPDIESLEIPYVPLPAQRRIAAILDKADAIRRKREEGIRLTEELLRSTFLEMFGDPATNPKGWAHTPLSDYITFMTSGSRGWAAHYANEGTRFIRSLDVQMNRIGEDDLAFVNPPNSSESERTRVRDGDVLLTITGSKVGRATYVPEGFGPAYVSQHVAILRLDGRVRPRFLSMFLADELGGQRLIKAAQYGQTKPGLNLEQIRAFSIPCPPLSLQDRFVALWRQWDQIQVQRSNSVAAAHNRFESLLQHAFRGEL